MGARQSAVQTSLFLYVSSRKADMLRILPEMSRGEAITAHMLN